MATSFLQAFSHLLPDTDQQQVHSLPFINSLHHHLSNKYIDEFHIPETEDVYSHKRQIKPGDHKNKLKAKTIQVMNMELSEILEQLEYQ